MSSRLVALVLLQASLATAWSAGDRDHLLYHVESVDGTVIASQLADEPFNPASVVKVGTSLWALERLGAGHRFLTRFGFTGTVDPNTGAIVGDFVVTGGGDPDFHLENVALVTRRLNAMGIERVTGDLIVTGAFWIGWEHGVEGRIDDRVARERAMGTRLLTALDSARWDPPSQAAWREMCVRRGWPERPRPRLVVDGGVRLSPSGEVHPLIVHESNPLLVTLKRFNTYSNNDIIRVADQLGGVSALEAFLWQRLAVVPPALELSTASGERRNRMTARTVVELMRELAAAAQTRHVSVADVLVNLGCDPGPTMRMFPRLASGPYAHTVVCKTGTLTTTDDGTAVLAGQVRSRAHGELLFCVAAPQAGRAISHWRKVEQDWLLDLIAGSGGAEPFACGDAFPMPDSFAEIEVPDRLEAGR